MHILTLSCREIILMGAVIYGREFTSFSVFNIIINIILLLWKNKTRFIPILINKKYNILKWSCARKQLTSFVCNRLYILVFADPRITPYRRVIVPVRYIIYHDNHLCGRHSPRRYCFHKVKLIILYNSLNVNTAILNERSVCFLLNG